jgi:hypothetical protein
MAAVSGNSDINIIHNIILTIDSNTTVNVPNIGKIKSRSSQISYYDFKNLVASSINYTVQDNKMTYARTIHSNGKMTLITEDGQRNEIPFDFPIDLISTVYFDIPADAEVVKMEIFNDIEAYVVKYVVQNEKQAPIDATLYFDKASGHIIGYKSITPLPTINDEMESLTIFSDFKEFNGLNFSTKSMVTSSSKSMQSNYETYSNYYFNVDGEDFKNNCFQNPKSCYSTYFK